MKSLSLNSNSSYLRKFCLIQLQRKHLLLIPWLVIQHIILVVLVFFIAAACVFVVDWMPKHTEVPKLSEVVRTVALFLETVLSFGIKKWITLHNVRRQSSKPLFYLFYLYLKGLLAYAWLAMFSLYNQIHESQSDASRRISWNPRLRL